MGEKSRLNARLEDLPQDLLDEVLWLNTVVTFSVRSASYWRGRAGACVMRLTHYMLGSTNLICALFYSDGGWLVGRTDHYERSAFALACLDRGGCAI